jgi:hypothetical protein
MTTPQVLIVVPPNDEASTAEADVGGWSESPDDDAIVLRVPSSARWIRLARLVVTGVANSAGFGADALEDARVAIDEACGILVERCPPSGLHITFRQANGSIEVDVACRAPLDCSPPAGLALEVLGAVTTSWDMHRQGDRLVLHLVVTDAQ